MLASERVKISLELIVRVAHGDEQIAELHVVGSRREVVECLDRFSQEGLRDHGRFLPLMVIGTHPQATFRRNTDCRLRPRAALER